jgi:small-conductance mechanosensitive channel/CRP-like cAMP-binding protein
LSRAPGSLRASRFWAPLVWAAAFFGLYWALWWEPRLLGGSAELRQTILGKDRQYLWFLAIAATIVLVVRLVDALIFDLSLRTRRNVVAPQLLRQISSFALYVILFGLAIKDVFHYTWTSVIPILTGGTVVAAIVGLALQDTLGNLFSGIALHMEGSYEVGDVIHSGDYSGLVESVNWRATRLRGYNNQRIFLPNSVIARERLEVFPRSHLNGRVLTFNIEAEALPAKVIDVLTHAAAHVDGVARETPCSARVASFAESSVAYELKYFTHDYFQRDRIDAEIRRAVWYALRRNRISVPYPVRTYRRFVETQKAYEFTTEDVLERLREIDVLAPLAPDELEAIAADARQHSYSRGETIIRKGTAGDSMFVVAEGDVSIRNPDDTSVGRRDVARLGAGSVFGEMALLTGEVRAADVVAVTDVTVLEITKGALAPILLQNPDLATAISAKVMERQQVKAHVTIAGQEDTSILSRIRSYFGLRP